MKKRALCLFLSLIMCLICCPFSMSKAAESTVANILEYDSRSDETEYVITSAEGIMKFSSLASETTFKGVTINLLCDVDMSNFSYVPFTSFSGTFNGNYNSIKNIEMVTFCINTGFIGAINSSGVVTNYEKERFVISNYIDVAGYKRIHVKCSANFSNAGCVFYNSDYSVNQVAIKNPDTGSSWNVSENVVLSVPKDAKYMVLAGSNTPTGVFPSYDYFEGFVLKNNIVPRLASAENSIAKLEDDIGDITDKVYTPFSITPIQGKLIKDSGAILDYDSTWYYVTDYIDVSGKEKVYVDCACTWTNAACAFYNSDYSVNSVPIKNTTSSGNDWNTRLDVEVAVPAGAKYMVLSGTSSGTSVMPAARYEGGVEVKKIWKGKKWCCVGDSLTERNSRTTKNYADYVSEETGISIVNMGVSGTGYKRQYENNLAFYQRVANVPLDSDVVTIFGSGNDQSYFGVSEMGAATDTGTTTLGGCINTTIDNLYAVFPAVHLGIVSPTPWGGYNPANHDNGMARYSALLEEICRNRSIPFLDLYHCSNLRPWDSAFLPIAYSHDEGNSVHPDETGHALIAGRFKVFVESLLT